MWGSITARTPDYLGFLVAASIVALLNAVLTALCVKFEEGRLAWFWAACYLGSALVGRVHNASTIPYP